MPRFVRSALVSKRRALAALVLLLATAVLVIACTRTKDLKFEILVPREIANETSWIEVSVYDNVQCNLAGRVAYGEAPVQGPVKRLVFAPGDENTVIPAIGDLEPGYYAFVAQVKNENCEVIARGCDGLEIGSASTVHIDIIPETQTGPACGSDLVCTLGQCVPKRTGANCSLDVIGSGPLSVYVPSEDSFTQENDTEGLAIAAPAAAVLPSQFLVSYGQFQVDRGESTVAIRQPIARGGGLFPFKYTNFSGRCTAYPQQDGTGLAWSGPDNVGVLGLTRTECGDDGPGNKWIELLGFDATLDKPTRSVKLTLGDIGTGEISFGQNHALASLGGGRWGVSPVVDDRARAVFLGETGGAGETGAAFEILKNGSNEQAIVSFGIDTTDADNPTRQISANLAASSSAIALVAINENDTNPNLDDGTSDAGSDDAGTEDPDAGDAGEGELGGQQIRQGEVAVTYKRLSVQFMDANDVSSPGNLTLPFVPDDPSRFASVALVDNRAFIVADGPTPKDPNLYAINFDPSLPRTEALKAESYAILTNGEAQSSQVDYADVAVANDRVFIATAVPGDIILSVFVQAANGPTADRVVRLSQLRASTVSSVRDGRVSVAVANNRVLVVWTTATVLRANDPLGGYAIFACEP